MATDWSTLRARLPRLMSDVQLGKFKRADEDTYLAGSWRLAGRPVRIHLECDPHEEDFETAAAQARMLRDRVAAYVEQAKSFASAHLLGPDSPTSSTATAHLHPNLIWFYGDGTWCIHFKDGEARGMSGLAWGNSIIVQFAGTQPTHATIED